MTQNRKPIFTGLMTALVFLTTFLIKIPVPYTNGYIHLGDSMIFLSVLAVGPFYAAFAAGVGSMLADVAAGYVQYAVPTLVIKAMMALVMGMVMTGTGKKRWFVSTGIVSAVWIGFVVTIQSMLASAMRQYGDKLALIVNPEGSAEDLTKTNQIAERIPVYLTIALVCAVILIALTALWLSKREARNAIPAKVLLGMVASGMVMLAGYYVVETFMYGPIIPIFSIPMNLVQFAGGILIASALAPVVQKATALRQ